MLFRLQSFGYPAQDMILLVDDNKVSREAFGKILRLYGHEVLEASDATDALDILTRENVELIITDFVMPEINGVQLVERIRKDRPKTPILMMSGYLTSEVAPMVSKGVEFIPKPVDVPLLLQTISRMVLPAQPA